MLNTNERNALSKALHLNGAALVQRLEAGRYLVPSATDADTTYVVTGTGLRASELSCTCEGASFGRACWHRAAVQLRKTQENAKAQARKLAQRQQPAAAATATFRFNGVEYRGEGRNVLDALGNATAA